MKCTCWYAEFFNITKLPSTGSFKLNPYILQKQPSDVFFKKNSYYRRTPLRLQLYQKRLQHRRFPVNIAKFLEHLFWGTCANVFGCFWFLLTKAKMQFSYNFCTSHNTINWRHISASNVYLILNVWLKMSSHVELYILYIRGTVYMKNCNLCLLSINK